jgi:hypothetical protein
VLIGAGVIAAAGTVVPGRTWIRDVAAVCFVGALIGSLLLLAGMVMRIRHPGHQLSLHTTLHAGCTCNSSSLTEQLLLVSPNGPSKSDRVGAQISTQPKGTADDLSLAPLCLLGSFLHRLVKLGTDFGEQLLFVLIWLHVSTYRYRSGVTQYRHTTN